MVAKRAAEGRFFRESQPQFSRHPVISNYGEHEGFFSAI
jgi:hypothetical protein